MLYLLPALVAVASLHVMLYLCLSELECDYRFNVDP